MTYTTQLDTFPFRNVMLGFDQLFEDLSSKNMSSNYPPYNIIKNDDTEYIVEMALAGWTIDNLDIEEYENTLTISGEKTPDNTTGEYIHKGIGNRAFNRQFTIAEHMHVEKAEFSNGILKLYLKVELPDSLKPKKIYINYEDRPVLEAA